MSTLIYRSAFSSESTATTKTGQSSSSAATPQTTDRSTHIASSQGSLASFICHVTYLDDKLRRGDLSSLFDEKGDVNTVSRIELGSGASFIVDRGEIAVGAETEYVAIKSVREQPQATAHWRDILLEIRALLHEPIRYHPNIVRLLDINWSTSGSGYPTLVLEYAELGSLFHLQTSAPRLPWRIKQKLCYDVGRGLSLLHACDIVHGDLKHENVLIFKNKYTTIEGQPYTAKLADFGGSVMDFVQKQNVSLHMGTPPFDAPEAGQVLDVAHVKKTDVYSFGMLFWRCLLDCKDLLVEIGLPKQQGPLTDEQKKQLAMLKSDNRFVMLVVKSAYEHLRAHNAHDEWSEPITLVLACTLISQPAARNFTRAMARLRGIKREDVDNYEATVTAANQAIFQSDQNRIPGRHGMDIDQVGYGIGRLGDDYDAQNNLPGFRPRMLSPNLGGFVFDPSKLRLILDWSTQKIIVQELEKNALKWKHNPNSMDLQPWKAAYCLFQCHMFDFGSHLDADEACKWLSFAFLTETENDADVNYWARAWLYRISTALDVKVPVSTEQHFQNLLLSQFRGHRQSMEDSKFVIQQLDNDDLRNKWTTQVEESDYYMRTYLGGWGMADYFPRNMKRNYNLDNLESLDAEIKNEVGTDYDACLRKNRVDGSEEKRPESGFRLDKVYVNRRGHGLLHYAATVNKLPALKYLLEKYECDINLANQSLSDSPLVCACRSGHFDCAMHLLDCGADPNGTQFGQESPLHWLCSFNNPEQMRVIARRLVETGADIQRPTGHMRQEIRAIFADWEDNLGVPVSPLGRAILMRSMPAVKLLLELGADPLCTNGAENTTFVSALNLAAMLTLPDILQTLLAHVLKSGSPEAEAYNEIKMLRDAHSRDRLHHDPLTLQSRLVRCGSNYKAWLQQTLQILHRNYSKKDFEASAKQICEEVRLNNVDIVTSLLTLGHDANGCKGNRPIGVAIETNNFTIFELLLRHGANVDFGTSVQGGRTYSPLQALASRPATSPGGTSIAEYLLDHGFTADLPPAAEGTPSALVLAVKNRYFDLADFLISKGADVNYRYSVTPDSDRRATILSELLSSHDIASLESISYLARKHKESTAENADQKTTAKLSPVVESSSGWTAMHLLASCSRDVMNYRSQISAQIIQLMLDIFPGPSSLGGYSPEVGTPLCTAAKIGNLEMILALLPSAYRADLNIGTNSKDGKVDTPLALAMSKYSTELEISSPSSERLKSLDRLMLIVSLLLDAGATGPRSDHHNEDSTSGKDFGRFEKQFSELKTKHEILKEMFKLEMQVQALSTADPASDRPVDLSVLTEEKPSGWYEGCEMTAEMSQRIFLRTFRSGEGLGDTVHGRMAKLFNNPRI